MIAPAGDLRAGVGAIRRSVALHVRSDLTLLRFEANEGLAALDPLVATSLATRDGQFRHALRLDPQGCPLADLLLGFLRGTMHVVASGLDHPAMIDALGAAGAVPAHEDHVVIGLDGPFAWELLAAWDTPAAIGLPYLGAYSPRDGLLVIRAGGTGEYGYRIVVHRDEADAVWDALWEKAAPFEPAVAGPAALRHCALENWTFDIERDAPTGLDALELQLTWRLDLHKDAVGLDAIRAHREAGLRRRITAIEAAAPVPAGAAVHAAGHAIGRVLATAPNLFGEGYRVLCVLDMPWAAAGMEYEVDGQTVRTVSAPFVLNRSLFVNPQRHGWTARDEIEVPERLKWPATTSS